MLEAHLTEQIQPLRLKTGGMRYSKTQELSKQEEWL